MNMAKAVARGYGLEVYYDDISEERVSAAINELLKNPKYSKNAKEISARFKDRPMTPQQAVVYWTEYAVRHNGAPHLRAAGVDLNYFQLRSYDVYAVMLLIFIVILYIDYKILKWILRKCFGKSEKFKLKKN